MDIFNVLTMIGGLCLFLFGMNLMGDALERRAGSSLRVLLGKLTTNRMLGFLTGLAVTGVIQSSSATTVMVVGFVNSGLLAAFLLVGHGLSLEAFLSNKVFANANAAVLTPTPEDRQGLIKYLARFWAQLPAERAAVSNN